MSKIWVKFGKNNSTQVSSQGSSNVDDFLEACKKKLLFLYGDFPKGEPSLSNTDGGTPLKPDDSIPAQNTANTPLFISVAVAEQAQKEMVSMPYGKATMSFISEATGVEDDTSISSLIPIYRYVAGHPNACMHYSFKFGEAIE
jgi:hypothetical protein